MGIAHPVMEEETETDHQYGVHQQVIAVLAGDEVFRCQPEIVQVEHDHHQHGRQAVHQVSDECHASASHIRQGRQEHERPERHMQEDGQFLIHDGWLLSDPYWQPSVRGYSRRAHR